MLPLLLGPVEPEARQGTKAIMQHYPFLVMLFALVN